MKALLLSLFAVSASAQTFLDGGILLKTPNGGTITLVPNDYFRDDGGLVTYLEIDTGFVWNHGELYTSDVHLLDDTNCIHWPTGAQAFCEDKGESTLGTIKITTPYNLQVLGTIDAGTVLQNGAPVCTTCPCP